VRADHDDDGPQAGLQGRFGYGPHEGPAAPFEQLFGTPEARALARGQENAGHPLKGLEFAALERTNHDGIEAVEQSPGQFPGPGQRLARFGLIEQGQTSGARGNVLEAALWMQQQARQGFGGDGAIQRQPAQGREAPRAVDVFRPQRPAQSAQPGHDHHAAHKIGDGWLVGPWGLERLLTRAVGFDQQRKIGRAALSIQAQQGFRRESPGASILSKATAEQRHPLRRESEEGVVGRGHHEMAIGERDLPRAEVRRGGHDHGRREPARQLEQSRGLASRADQGQGKRSGTQAQSVGEMHASALRIQHQDMPAALRDDQAALAQFGRHGDGRGMTQVCQVE